MRSLLRQREGQSLLETAFVLPILLVMVFNAINLGYCFFAYLNLATAPRQGAEYSIQGPDTLQGSDFPPAAGVWSLVNEGITGAIPSAANTPVRLCIISLGINPVGIGTSSQVPNCGDYGTSAGTFSTLQPDPEAPLLVLNRVDIQYTITPLIPGIAFNMGLPNPLILHRYVYMRTE
jgi:TadE-like protein